MPTPFCGGFFGFAISNFPTKASSKLQRLQESGGTISGNLTNIVDAGKDTQNHGSAIGEAIGSLLELALHDALHKICKGLSLELLTHGGTATKTSTTKKKLLISDDGGTKYNLDGIIINEGRQPIVLLESKWIRYKKHNRDKGSWIANSHREIKKKYPTVRGSLALLAGEWSLTSLEMLEQAQITVIRIAFDQVADRLLEDGIDIRWEEKDRVKSEVAWRKFQKLDAGVIKRIGKDLLDLVKFDLIHFMQTINEPREAFELTSLTITIEESGGWIRTRKLQSVNEAINFLQELNIGEVFSTENGPTLD